MPRLNPDQPPPQALARCSWCATPPAHGSGSSFTLSPVVGDRPSTCSHLPRRSAPGCPLRTGLPAVKANTRLLRFSRARWAPVAVAAEFHARPPSMGIPIPSAGSGGSHRPTSASAPAASATFRSALPWLSASLTNSPKPDLEVCLHSGTAQDWMNRPRTRLVDFQCLPCGGSADRLRLISFNPQPIKGSQNLCVS